MEVELQEKRGITSKGFPTADQIRFKLNKTRETTTVVIPTVDG